VNRPDFAAGLWRLADPKISLASMVSIFLGACAAAAVGAINYLWLALTVVGIFTIEVAKNASGEIFDFDSGAGSHREIAVRFREGSGF
jgi:1,4-dihydroxy-2-naphthoate octaprenyltransferase